MPAAQLKKFRVFVFQKISQGKKANPGLLMRVFYVKQSGLLKKIECCF